MIYKIRANERFTEQPKSLRKGNLIYKFHQIGCISFYNNQYPQVLWWLSAVLSPAQCLVRVATPTHTAINFGIREKKSFHTIGAKNKAASATREVITTFG